MLKVVGRAHVWVQCAGALLLVLVGLWVACLLRGPDAEVQQLRLRTERAALLLERSELEAERTQVTSQFNQAQRALLSEHATRLELEKILANVQTELGRTQDQLAFFEDLLPPSPQSGLDIRAVDVVQHPEGLNYRVLLMRSGKVTKPFVGALQFIARGYFGKTTVAAEQTIILQPLLVRPVEPNQAGLGAQSQCAEAPRAESQQAATPHPDLQQAELQQIQTPPLWAQQNEARQTALRLNFAQFHRGQGLLAIPAGFVPTFVTVRVLDGDIVLASRVVAL